MTQRDKMRELFRLHQGDKATVIRAYAEAEQAGEVDRVRNASGYGTEQYARALWSDGEKKGWLGQDKTSSSGREKLIALTMPASSARLLIPNSLLSLPAPKLQERPTPDAFVAHLAAVKGNLQALKNAQYEVENTIAQMEQWIGMAVTSQPKLVESYIPTVREWLPGWDHLEEASQAFLPQAELLFESFSDSEYPDFSLFIINYCKALENEFLSKLFSVYTDNLRSRHPDDLEVFLTYALADKNTGLFAKKLKSGEKKYTLVEMARDMQLLTGKTISRVEMLGDFRVFVLNNFDEGVLSKTYLAQVERIGSEFRNKAAHPYLLGKDVAEECRVLVRECLNEFILNWRGSCQKEDVVNEPVEIATAADSQMEV